MSRNKGTFNFAANFEVLAKAPLDARMNVGSYEDLVDPSTWLDNDGNIWLYKGAIVSVANDPSAGIYFLSDETGYTDYANWIPAGTGTSVDSSLSIVNIGAGDVSIYAGLVDNTAQFREFKAGPGITLSYDDSSTIIIGAPGAAGSANGGVFITDINATNVGNVGNKVYSSDGAVLDSCLTDTNDITLSILAITGNTNYKPNVFVGASLVTLSADPDKPLFNGTISIDLQDASSVTVIHEDGASHTTNIEYEVQPNILGANFIGGYPGTQTELKAGDTFDVSIVTDSIVDQVEIINIGAFISDTIAVANTDNFVVTGTIANRGNTVTESGFVIRVRKPSGSWSDTYVSALDGSVNGTNIVNLNNLYPTISFGTVTYPATQQAIKNGESATVQNTITDADIYNYTSQTGELSISNPTTYESNKNVDYLSGGYNVSSDNIGVSATRSANDATSSDTSLVQIANSPATLTVVNGASRFRSGGNDGTTIQNHTITIQSDQILPLSPTLESSPGGGAWQTSSTFSGGPLTWTNVLQVHDDDTKTVYAWGALSGTNLAGIETTLNTGAADYTLGGFVNRTLTVPPFATSVTMGVAAIDYSKIGNILNWSVKSLPNKRPVGTTTTPDVGGWSIANLGINPTTINILDIAAAGSSSQSSTITIQELV